MFLPATESEPVEDRQRPAEPVGGGERIVCVDDEPVLLDLQAELLRSLGYEVTTFSSSHEALHSLESDPMAADLLLTDQTMPELTGVDLIQRVRAVRPELPVVLCTGYSDGISEGSARAAGIDFFLTKPVGLEGLATAVREALDHDPRDE